MNTSRRRKKIRCSMCTPYRWRGNSKLRFKGKEQLARSVSAQEIREVLNGRPRPEVLVQMPQLSTIGIH